ncbi:hypothetical protein B0J11DRAFT_447101 [Dendryphion nanum]|uniref:IDI-2 n=1 Tax=Dendryphion nanum TaxID=256645 RepID=A0A9P9D421_9PLEO|nr:hypothetical protein B0J11DRAFT_447101 [Dendryphion nanum]
MKFTTTVILLATRMAQVYSVSLAEAQCGSLGVMNVNPTDLPEGVKLSDVRTCLDHPDNLDRSQTLAKRACEPKGLGYGCNKNGWCWRRCGDTKKGEWCWLAHNGGYGNWMSCGSDEECKTNGACGRGDGCKKCGCNCDKK